MMRWGVFGKTVVGLTFAGAATIGLLAGCDAQRSASAGRETKTLTVLTPHNEDIRYAFAAGFARWYAERNEANVHIDWIYRGTPQCVDFVRSIPEMRAAGGAVLPDVMFGGGVADHQTLADEQFCQALTLDEAVASLPTEINGVQTHDPNNRWFATGISSFGLLVNADACAARGVAPPETWADLADPRFFSWLAIAEPSGSGSHRECLTITLQQLGWEEGWPVVQRMLANTRALSGRSGAALGLVESGQALATFAVNFDGLARAARTEGLRYLDPDGATVLTPDIMSVLTTSRNKELAAQFVRFVLSEPGQVLWSVSADQRVSPGETLYHYPILPSIYEKYAGKLSVERNPLAEDIGVDFDAELGALQGRVLKDLVAAACGENHVALQRTWGALIDAGMPAEPLARLTAPPFAADELPALAAKLDDEEQRAQLTSEWTQMFAERYAAVAKMLD